MNRFVALTLAAVAVSFSIDPDAGADAPPGRYTASNGTVTDNETGLVWSQTEQPGGPWAWVDAQNQCPAPWRVPTVQELRSIVDLTQTTAPTIDPSAFYGPTGGSAPNAGGFWTSSPYLLEASLGYAYYVDFDNGGIDANVPTTPRGVRCVQ
jgi:Protein of unknown function (DUF1566)